jgi:hypothetical protein
MRKNDRRNLLIERRGARLSGGCRTADLRAPVTSFMPQQNLGLSVFSRAIATGAA